MFSDSLSDSSRGDGQESFTTSPSLEMNKQQLKELNSELAKENALLRSQFEEAVEVTAQLQDLHTKNQELVTQIRNLQAEKDDLDHRLEISLATNKELTKRLNDEKKNRSQQNDTNINAMNNEIERVKEQSKAQLDSVLEELEKMKSVHEKDVLQQKTIVGRIDRTLQSSERYFQTKFSTIDDLIEFFEHPSQQSKNGQNAGDSVPKLVKPLGAMNNNTEYLEKKVKHLKAKLRSAENDKTELQEELQRTQRESHTFKLNTQQQISDLQSQMNSLTEDYQANDKQKVQKIATLESQVESLKSDLSKARSQFDPNFISIRSSQASTASQQPSASNNPNLPKPLKKANKPEDIERIQKLQGQVDDLNEKIKFQDKKKLDMEQKLREAENEIHAQKQQIEKMKTENNTLNSLNESSKAEIETLRSALHTKKEPFTIDQIPQPKQPANVIKYQRAIEEQKGKINSLTQQNDKLKKQVEKQEQDLLDFSEKLNHANATTRKINDEFAEYRSKVESKKPITADDILPAEAFRCPEFDSLLSSNIQKISGNQSLQPVTKIQTCFKAIASHFGKQLQDLQEAFNDTMKENQFLSSSFNKFIVDLSIALCDQPATVEDFFKGNGGQQLIEKVADFRVRFDDMKHQNDRFNEIVAYLEDSFGTAGQNIDPIQQIADIKNQFTNQCDIIAQKSAKIKKMRHDLRDLVQSSDKNKLESSQRIEDLTNAVTKLESQLATLDKSAKSLKQENQNLQVDLADATRRANQNEEDFKEREKEVVNKLISEHSTKYNNLNAKYNNLSTQYSELVDEFNSQSEEIRNYEENIDNLKKTISNKEREINDLHKDLKNKDYQFDERLEDEKQQLSRTFQLAIDQLNEQCEKHRLDVEKMAKVVSDNEKSVAIIKSENLILKKEKLKTDQDMKSLSTKFDREKKLMETIFTSKRIQYETAVNQKLNDERTRFEAEKRKMCGFAIESFKMFFDANVVIDEKSYRHVIEVAHDELDKLTRMDASIRRIVGAREGQTTEDAVAQVIMGQV